MYLKMWYQAIKGVLSKDNTMEAKFGDNFRN